MKTLLLIALAALLVISFIFAGCNANPTTPAAVSPAAKAPPAANAAPPASPSFTPQTGGTMSMYLPQDPISFWPPTMTGQTDGQNSGLALETLFRFDLQGNVVPLLATDWKADANARTITITLRQGVKFQDGSDFNASVCKWNMEQHKASNKGELKKVTSIDVVDNNTVRLNLSTFDNTIITNLANCSDAGRMISQKAFEANGGKEWAAKNPVGTGPFQLASWTKSVGINWKRFEGYWGGKPYLDGIQMKIIADQTVATFEFKSGNLHIFRPQETSNARSLQETGLYRVVTPPEGQIPALAGYAKDPASPFANVQVRQAMSYAIDVKQMNDSFGLGYWKAINQWAVPGTPGYSPEVVGYPYNVQKAKDLLTAAGYPSGFKTTLNFFNTSQTYIDEGAAIQNYLKAVGIDVTLNPLQRPAFADMASNGKGWSGIIRQQGYSNPDPLIKFAGTVASQEFVGIVLPQEVIDAYNAAITAPDPSAKQKLTWKFMSLTVDKYCLATYLYAQESPTVKSKNLHDDYYSEIPFFYMSPMAWLSK